jgi:hypothetical protein
MRRVFKSCRFIGASLAHSARTSARHKTRTKAAQIKAAAAEMVPQPMASAPEVRRGQASSAKIAARITDHQSFAQTSRGSRI